MKDNTKILGALVLGAAAGAVLGLLFAPSKGKDLRSKIKDNADELLDELEERINEGKQTLADITEKVMSKAGEYKSRAEEEGFGDKTEKSKNGESRKKDFSTT